MITKLIEDKTKLVSGGNCWEDWSRCSEWSSSLTDILWRNCNDHCIKDLHKPKGGKCVKTKNTCPELLDKSEMIYQCQCTN